MSSSFTGRAISDTPLLSTLQSRLLAGQNAASLPDLIGGSLTLDRYGQIIKPFINTKAAPNNLANEIKTRANTEAVIMVVDNKSGVIKHITNKFYLSSMQMGMREKVQLLETFGAANISFFGDAVKIYTFKANTVDAPSQDSGIEMGKYFYQSSILKMYNSVLRGTQLIKDDRIAVIKTNNHVIYGYPLNLNIFYNAAQDPVTSFSLQFIVADHTLEIPGVVTEPYLEKMYSTAVHINTVALEAFIDKINDLVTRIDAVLDTKVGEEGLFIQNIQTRYFDQYNYPTDMKSAFTAALTASVGALKTEIAGALEGQISPLVHSKVPANTIDRLLALISSMFKDNETYNFVATQLNNLIELKKELFTFKIYRMNRTETLQIIE